MLATAPFLVKINKITRISFRMRSIVDPKFCQLATGTKCLRHIPVRIFNLLLILEHGLLLLFQKLVKSIHPFLKELVLRDKIIDLM